MFPNALVPTDMFGNDNSIRNSMHQMNQMMNSFFGGFPDPMAGMMGAGGGMFNPMMGTMMGSIMDNHLGMMANPQGQSFSSSTFMSYSSNGPNGQPQVYKASTSTRTGPGGIKETKKAVSDSRTGVKKLAIGHHIGDRAHIVERKKNLYSGDQEENEEYINLDDNEAEDFNNEWRNKAQSFNSHRAVRYTPYNNRVQNSSVPLKRNLKALPSTTTNNSDPLAIESPPVVAEQGRKRSAKQRTPKKILQHPTVNDA